MGWWEDLTRAVGSVISSIGKTVNEAVATVERATGIDIPGIGTDLSKEKSKETQKQKHEKKTQTTPQPSSKAQPKTQTTSPTAKTTPAVPSVSSTGGGGSGSHRHSVGGGGDPLKAISEAVGGIASTLGKAVNEAVAGFEKFTGIDIPGVGTTLTQKQTQEAPVQKYIQTATNTKTYGLGWTHQAVQTVQNIVQPTTPTTVPKGPVDELINIGKTFVASAGSTLAGGVVFIPDTIAEEVKAGERLIKGDVGGAVYHATRPIAMVGAGLVGVGGAVLDWVQKFSKAQKETIEGYMAMGQMLLTHKATPQTVKEIKEMAEAQRQFLYSTAEVGGMAVGLYGLGKIYSRVSKPIKNTYLRIKSKISKSYIEDPGIRWIESTTIPKTREQLLATQGKEVTAVHMTYHP